MVLPRSLCLPFWPPTCSPACRDAASKYAEAASIFADVKDTRAEAWARNGLGMSLHGLGDYRRASDSYRAAARLARESQDIPVEGMAANNLGSLEHAIDGDAAEGEDPDLSFGDPGIPVQDLVGWEETIPGL